MKLLALAAGTLMSFSAAAHPGNGIVAFLLENKTTERNNYGPRVRTVSASGKTEGLGEVNGER